MRFYTHQHKYYCGLDLHANTIYACILDREGKVLEHKEIKSNPAALMVLLTPYLEDVVVGAECVFCWYWVADLCADKKIPFALGHALYMKAIHGGKVKNDRIDSRKIAGLLKGGMFPVGYVYPREMRSCRDLLRRRSFLVCKRSELSAHIQLTRMQYNLGSFEKKVRQYTGNQKAITDRFNDPFVKKNVETDLGIIIYLDKAIHDLDLMILKSARKHDRQSFEIIDSVYGIGDVLAMTILYEIHTINRFKRVQDFLSYCRLVKPRHESAGKSVSSGKKKKIGNHYLKWAFSEAAVHFLKGNDLAQEKFKKLECEYGKAKALSILAARIGRAVYFMLDKQRNFDMKQFLEAL